MKDDERERERSRVGMHHTKTDNFDLPMTKNYVLVIDPVLRTTAAKQRNRQNDRKLAQKHAKNQQTATPKICN